MGLIMPMNYGIDLIKLITALTYKISIKFWFVAVVIVGLQ